MRQKFGKNLARSGGLANECQPAGILLKVQVHEIASS